MHGYAKAVCYATQNVNLKYCLISFCISIVTIRINSSYKSCLLCKHAVKCNRLQYFVIVLIYREHSQVVEQLLQFPSALNINVNSYWVLANIEYGIYSGTRGHSRVWVLFTFGKHSILAKIIVINVVRPTYHTQRKQCFYMYVCVRVTNICVNLWVDMFIIRKLIPLFTYQMSCS